MIKGFFKQGHTPTLVSAFLYFEVSCMIWLILGSLGVHISRDLGLHPAEKGLMVALPVLFGAFLRIPAGFLADRFGSRRIGQVGQVLVIAALLSAWLFGLSNLANVYLMGFFLGIGGASFAIALPLASRWYPPQYQGLVLGIVGAGNSGTVFAALFAPRLAEMFGWQIVFGLAAIPGVVVLVVYTFFAKDAPKQERACEQQWYYHVLKEPDTWWFCLFYLVTFGGFVGLASSLVIYFNDEYVLSPVSAGNFAAICVFIGSVFRVVGGAFADRVGGVRALVVLYAMVTLSLLAISSGLASSSLALFVFSAAMLALGMGNGAVFQLVSLRFGKEIGTVTGIVGTAGGIGGFCLASLLGFSKEWTDSYQLGFIAFASLAVFCLIGILIIKTRWRTSWDTSSSVAVKI